MEMTNKWPTDEYLFLRWKSDSNGKKEEYNNPSWGGKFHDKAVKNTRVPEYNGILELQQLTGEEHTSFCFLSKQVETLSILLTPH